jgi:hypothetical protein
MEALGSIADGAVQGAVAGATRVFTSTRSAGGLGACAGSGAGPITQPQASARGAVTASPAGDDVQRRSEPFSAQQHEDMSSAVIVAQRTA